MENYGGINISHAELLLMQGRTIGDQLETLRAIYASQGRGYSGKPSEVGYRDQWLEPYMGRDYAGGRKVSGYADNYELLTIGVESLYYSRYAMDAGMRSWLLGVLALL